MLVKYVTTSASTIAQVISDLMNLACGESIANLSASCDKVNSAVVANTIAPGWTLVDSAGPNSSVIISAPDAAGTYTKYLGLEPSSGYLIAKAYDKYNPATHTGTNACALSTSTYSATFIAGVVKTFYLYVTPRTFIISDLSMPTYMTACLEFTKDAAYFQNGITYPCHGITDGAIFYTGYGQTPRIKNQITSGDSVGNGPTRITLATITSLANGGTPFNAPLHDAVDNLYHPILPLFMNTYNTSNNLYQTILGKVYDLNLTTYNGGNTGDTVSDGTDTYFVMKLFGNNCCCFKIG